MLPFLTQRFPFLNRLRTDTPAEVYRIERVLATARAFLAVTSLAAIWIDSTEPSRYAAIAYGLLVAYVVYSLLILVWIRWRRETTTLFRLSIHAIDVLWPAVIALFTTGPNSPFFIFNTFVLLEAAYRWGFQETLATAGAEVVLYFAGTLVTVSGPVSSPFFLGGEFEPNRFIMRGLYLLIMGYLLGYLGGQEKSQRAEVSQIAGLMIKVQSEVGLRGALGAVLEEVCGLFKSNHALLILEETNTGRVYLWEGWRADRSREIAITSSELESSQRPEYSCEPPGKAWHAIGQDPAVRVSRARVFDLRGLDREGSAFRNAHWSPPGSFLASRAFGSLLGSVFSFRSDWKGTLMLLDPDIGSNRDAAVHFLHVLSQQISPAIYSVFVMRRLRSRAGAVERARVARELHDGVIQSLIGLEMQVDVLRRQAETPSDRIADDLGRIQKLLRQEVLNVRELMQQMNPLELGPKQLLDFLAYTVDKFRHNTGINANFVSSLEEVTIFPSVGSELARIVQEALVNVRKHSGARNVVVRFESGDGLWKLAVDDDGCGFDFSGRLAQNELDSTRKGPVVIKERVRAIGGELVIESNPGGGCRLEISVPQKSYE